LKIMHLLQNLNYTRNRNEVLIDALHRIVIIVTKFLDNKGTAVPTFSLLNCAVEEGIIMSNG